MQYDFQEGRVTWAGSETSFDGAAESKRLLDHGRKQPTRKSPVQIRFEILEYLFYNAGPHTRTSLWRHATQLSYDDFQKYLEYLKQKGFVEEAESEIRLAVSGRTFT